MIDIEKIRADVPAVDQRVHFNNAGMSLMPQPAYDAMLEYLALEQSIGGYEAAIERAADTRNFYDQAAQLLNCDASDIAFFEGATKAWQAFFYALKFEQGDRIITTTVDYGSNFVGFIQQSKRLGVEVDLVDYDENGDLDLAQLERLFSDRTRLVSLSHIPTANGLINPAERIGQLAREADVPFLLDACQSVGQINVDVGKIGCTALSATGRKYLRGPRGTGLLYVEPDFRRQLEPAMLDQCGVELINKDAYRIVDSCQRFENFEAGFASRIAFGKAIGYANSQGIDNIEQRIIELGQYCRRGLSALTAVHCHDTGKQQGGIVMFSVDQHSPESVRDYLAQHGVTVWVSSGPGGLIDFQKRNFDSLLRASIHYFNTESEIDRMINLLGDL